MTTAPDYSLIKPFSPEDWSEDKRHDGGIYQHRCALCDRLFVGSKGRFICKLCDGKSEIVVVERTT